MPSTRYTAHVQVVRIDETEEYSANNRGKIPKSDKTEVASITVRANDLEALRDKLVKHIELIDE